MRKGLIAISVAVFLSLLLHSCNQTPANTIVGKWRLDTLAMNGMVVTQNILGPSYWEFTDRGNYTSTIVKAVDKGRYELNDGGLTLNSNISQQKYTVIQLDSVVLSLTAVDTVNRTHLYLKRVQ